MCLKNCSFIYSKSLLGSQSVKLIGSLQRDISTIRMSKKSHRKKGKILLVYAYTSFSRKVYDLNFSVELESAKQSAGIRQFSA